MKKEEKLKVGRPKLADSKLKKKSVIISCICLVVALALLITGAFELNILKFNSKKLKASANTNLCGTDINIIPEELRYSETNLDGFKDIKFYSAVLSAGQTDRYTSPLYNSSEYCSTVTKEDLEQIGYLNASSAGLTDVSGVSYLTGLKGLTMSRNNIEDIDLSKNTGLELLSLSNNLISNIDLENNENLKFLFLSDNKLTSIDLSNLKKLKTLNLFNNQLTNLDLSNNNQIDTLNIFNNPYKTVILDNISAALGSIELQECNEIENLSIKNTKITGLSLQNISKIKNLDISNNDALANFSINNEAQIDNFIAENIPNLTSLNLSNHNISSVKLNNLPKLTSLSLYNNKLTTIDLSNLMNLSRLGLSENELTNIKFIENPVVAFNLFDLSNNNLSGNLDLTNLKFELNGNEFDLSNNKLDSLKLPCVTNSSLELSNNNLSSIEFTKPSEVKTLYAYNNKLESIDLSNLNNLEELFLDNNKLKNIDLSKFLNLNSIVLSNNELTNIDLSNVNNVRYLWLFNNNLTKLDISNLSDLEELNVHNNKLESIDLSNNVNLQGVTLQNNPMESTKYMLKGKTIDYKNIVNSENITYNADNESIGSFDGSVLKTKEVGVLNVTASNENILSVSADYFDKCVIDEDYSNNKEYCDNASDEDIILPYFYENKVIVYDVLSNNYKVDSESKTIDVSGLVPDTKYITLTEGFTGEIKGNKYLVKNSNNEVIEEFRLLNPGKKEEEVKKVTTTTKSSSKRVIKPNKKVTTKKLEDINLTGSFISSMMLNQVRGQDRKLTVTNEDVVLTMLGKDIKKTDSNIDISYTITDVKETEVKDKVEEGIVLDFINKTTLPCTSQVEVNVKDKITGNVDIYRYENGTLVLIAENVRITDNKLTFNTDKLDTYVITNKLKKDVEIKEDKTLIESNDKIKKSNKCLIVIPILLIIILIGVGTYIYKKKITK